MAVSPLQTFLHDSTCWVSLLPNSVVLVGFHSRDLKYFLSIQKKKKVKIVYNNAYLLKDIQEAVD